MLYEEKLIMKLRKLVVIALGSASVICASYDIEMFTFYPYHCESNLMKHMKKVFHGQVFIETGTLGGETAFTAASIFDSVYSVELSESLFKAAQKKNVYPNVFLSNDSSDHFLEMLLPLAHMQDKRKLFWLDAHASGGNTTSLIDADTGLAKSPIWGELTAILKNHLQDSVILIDDISGYLLSPEVNMRYPHLHQQYELIKKNCPTAHLYIIGDLAIAYDSAYNNPTISPIVQACTVSRMFDWYTSHFEDEQAVLMAEHALVKRCHEKEADRICYLSGYCHCRDYRLWRGLVYLGRGDFMKAADDFQFVLDAGLIHWRVRFYHAYALEKLGRKAQASTIFKSIHSQIKDHESFLKNTYSYQS